MTQKFFDRAYKITSQSDTNQLYDDWAASYDKEVGQYGYATPKRCAEALAKFLDLDASILDFGCGTGLSGAALRATGFKRIDGSEINSEMIKLARDRGVYRHLFDGDIDTPFPFGVGTYDAITAVGVISSGAGPASLLAIALQQLSPNGLICFSFNDHALEEPSFPAAVQSAIDTGLAEQLFCEYGDHLPEKGVGSNVYVLRRI